MGWREAETGFRILALVGTRQAMRRHISTTRAEMFLRIMRMGPVERLSREGAGRRERSRWLMTAAGVPVSGFEMTVRWKCDMGVP
jgi:hypothetical protein